MEVCKMSNKGWRIIAFSLIIIPVIVRVIIAMLVIYFPLSSMAESLIAILPIVVKIQNVAFILAIIISVKKIKKDTE